MKNITQSQDRRNFESYNFAPVLRENAPVLRENAPVFSQSEARKFFVYIIMVINARTSDLLFLRDRAVQERAIQRHRTSWW